MKRGISWAASVLTGTPRKTQIVEDEDGEMVRQHVTIRDSIKRRFQEAYSAALDWKLPLQTEASATVEELWRLGLASNGPVDMVNPPVQLDRRVVARTEAHASPSRIEASASQEGASTPAKTQLTSKTETPFKWKLPPSALQIPTPGSSQGRTMLAGTPRPDQPIFAQSYGNKYKTQKSLLFGERPKSAEEVQPQILVDGPGLRPIPGRRYLSAIRSPSATAQPVPGRRFLTAARSPPAAEAEGNTAEASRASPSSSPARLKPGGLRFPVGPQLVAKTNSGVQHPRGDSSGLAKPAALPAPKQPAKALGDFAARASTDVEAAKDQSSAPADGTTPSLPTRRLRRKATVTYGPGPSRLGPGPTTRLTARSRPTTAEATAGRQPMPGEPGFKPGHHLVTDAAKAILKAFEEPQDSSALMGSGGALALPAPPSTSQIDVVPKTSQKVEIGEASVKFSFKRTRPDKPEESSAEATKLVSEGAEPEQKPLAKRVRKTGKYGLTSDSEEEMEENIPPQSAATNPFKKLPPRRPEHGTALRELLSNVEPEGPVVDYKFDRFKPCSLEEYAKRAPGKKGTPAKSSAPTKDAAKDNATKEPPAADKGSSQSGWGAAFLQANKAKSVEATKHIEKIINQGNDEADPQPSKAIKFGVPASSASSLPEEQTKPAGGFSFSAAVKGSQGGFNFGVPSSTAASTSPAPLSPAPLFGMPARTEVKSEAEQKQSTGLFSFTGKPPQGGFMFGVPSAATSTEPLKFGLPTSSAAPSTSAPHTFGVPANNAANAAAPASLSAPALNLSLPSSNAAPVSSPLASAAPIGLSASNSSPAVFRFGQPSTNLGLGQSQPSPAGLAAPTEPSTGPLAQLANSDAAAISSQSGSKLFGSVPFTFGAAQPSSSPASALPGPAPSQIRTPPAAEAALGRQDDGGFAPMSISPPKASGDDPVANSSTAREGLSLTGASPSSKGFGGFGAFGAQPAAGGFGSQPGSQPGVFGSQPSSQPVTFGAQPSSQPGPFSSQPSSQPMAFGAQPSSQPVTCGSQPSSQPVTFGAQPSSQPGVFGSQPSSQPGLFGAASQPFGSQASSQPGAFGAGTQTASFGLPQPFGAAASAPDQAGAAPAFGAAAWMAPTQGGMSMGAGAAKPEERRKLKARRPAPRK